jgi:hypothetical protein
VFPNQVEIIPKIDPANGPLDGQVSYLMQQGESTNPTFPPETHEVLTLAIATQLPQATLLIKLLLGQVPLCNPPTGLFPT